jgi:hypothetical protein
MDCQGVGQPVAAGEATSCQGVGQPVAAEVDPGSKPIKKTHRTRPKRGCAAAAVFPSGLDTDVFREAWERWKKHRNEKHKPLTPTSTAAQLKELAEWGQDRAIAAINRSIKAGWTGIFEENQNGSGNRKQCDVASAARIRSGNPLPSRYATAATAPKNTAEA